MIGGRIETNVVAQAAQRIAGAADSGQPVPPVRDLLGASDITAAYAVQDELTRRGRDGGATVVDRKIGLTSAAVQRQLGVDQPDFGVLFSRSSPEPARWSTWIIAAVTTTADPPEVAIGM
jgi:2-keto-4-pentenoate hydratase